MKKFKTGVQLYSVREDMENDFAGTLKKVKEAGYDYVEFAGFFDKTSAEVKKLLEENDLKCISVHQGPQVWLEKGQESIDFLVDIGVKYCAIPWYEAEKLKGSEHWDETVKLFTDYANALKASGIKMMYHNHDFEFKKFEGKFLLDWIYDTIPEDLLEPQIDTCWVRYAGYDPCEYILKYSGKMHVLHLKDFTCKQFASGPAYELIGNDKAPSREDNGFVFKPVGSGIQDFPKILEAAEKAGIEYVIVEQDQSKDIPPMEAIKKSRDYLKSIGV